MSHLCRMSRPNAPFDEKIRSPTLIHYMSHLNVTPKEEIATSHYMSHPNRTLNKETISSILNLITCPIMTGFMTGKQKVLKNP